MSATVYLILAYLAWKLVAWCLRCLKRDPMEGRLVSRSPELHAQIVAEHRRQHDAFAEQHTAKLWKPST